MGKASDDLEAVRQLLPEGLRVHGKVAAIPKPGAIGVFIRLPGSLEGFVDVRTLPYKAGAWPAVGVEAEFEVLQHRPGQVRLWPLDPRFRRSDPGPAAETAWRAAKNAIPSAPPSQPK